MFVIEMVDRSGVAWPEGKGGRRPQAPEEEDPSTVFRTSNKRLGKLSAHLRVKTINSTRNITRGLHTGLEFIINRTLGRKIHRVSREPCHAISGWDRHPRPGIISQLLEEQSS